MKIKKLTARQILDSRGIPTIEVTAYSAKASAKFSVPSGASVGSFEAVELRDGNPHEFFGKGVRKAVTNVEEDINKLLKGKNPLYQNEIDSSLIEYDNTDNKSVLGANAILGVSIAIAKLVATEEDIPLFKYIRALYDPYLSFSLASKYHCPVPMFNMINGGAHANNSISAQEFMLIPSKARNTKNKIRIIAEINHTLKESLSQLKQSTSIGDEGGFAAIFNNSANKVETNTEYILELLMSVIKKAGYIAGEDIFFGLDVAVTRYFHDTAKGIYNIPNWTRAGDFIGNFDYLLDTYKNLVKNYPILSIEDPAAENDWSSWVKIKRELGKEIYVVGDDLTVTNPKRLQKAILLNCINSIIIKPNQIGTLTEVFKTASKAHDNKIDLIVSHRSGDTTDDFISDLAVGINAKFIKSGNLMRGERVSKYNRLMEIEDLIQTI